MPRWTLLPIALVVIGCQDAVRGKAVPVDTDGSTADQAADVGANPDSLTSFDAADAGTSDTVLSNEAATEDSAEVGADSPIDHDTDASAPLQISTISSEIAVDDTYVYAFQNQELVRIPKAGGSAFVISTIAGAAYPFAIDATHAYFVDELTIHKVAKSGGAWVDMAPQGGATGHVGVALDDQRVFFLTINDRVFEVAKDAVGGTELYNPDTYDFPTLVAAGSDALYWAEVRSTQKTCSVVRHVWAGGSNSTVGGGQEVFALTARGTSVYWIDREMSVSASVQGGGAQALVTNQIGAKAIDLPVLAVDDSHAYWASRANGAVYRVPVQGGAHELVVSGFDFPVQTAATTEYTIWKQRQRLAIDDQYLYFSDSTGIYRVRK